MNQYRFFNQGAEHVLKPLQFVVDGSWRIYYWRRVQHCSTIHDLFWTRPVRDVVKPERFEQVPFGIMPRSKRFPNARRAIAETNVMASTTGVTKFCEAPILLSLNKGACTRRLLVTHRNTFSVEVKHRVVKVLAVA